MGFIFKKTQNTWLTIIFFLNQCHGLSLQAAKPTAQPFAHTSPPRPSGMGERIREKK